MGAMVGFVIGYLVGTRAGEKGRSELLEAWQTIVNSEEVRDLVSGGLSMARDFVQHGSGMLAERLQEERGVLHRVA
jgi:hypothetical protein